MIELDYRTDEVRPTHAHPGDAGVDLRADIDAVAHIAPRRTVAIPTGVKWDCDDPSVVGMVCSRSGLALRGLVVANAPGIVDSGYTGEIKVLLLNTSDRAVTVRRLDRIAQLVVMPIVPPAGMFGLVDGDESDVRGENGFGSSGVN